MGFRRRDVMVRLSAAGRIHWLPAMVGRATIEKAAKAREFLQPRQLI
jgi:hypothetical protein